jgi:hypothetical protein
VSSIEMGLGGRAGVHVGALGAGGDGRIAPRPCGRDGRRLLEQLRVVARHLETAVLLERRAGLSGNRVLAALLDERAAGHRQAADRVRCGLGPANRAHGGVGTRVG